MGILEDGIGVTSVIGLLSVAAVGTVLGGLALTTITGGTNKLGFNGTTLAYSAKDLIQTVTGYEPEDKSVVTDDYDDDQDVNATAESLSDLSKWMSTAKKARRGVCRSQTIRPSGTNLNLAFEAAGRRVYVSGQVYGAGVSNVSYPMLVLSSAPLCSVGLGAASRLSFHPLKLGEDAAEAPDVITLPKEKFDSDVLHLSPRTVWFHADGKTQEKACCEVRRLF